FPPSVIVTNLHVFSSWTAQQRRRYFQTLPKLCDRQGRGQEKRVSEASFLVPSKDFLTLIFSEPRSITEGKAETSVSDSVATFHRMPRYFSWVIPHVLAAQSTPRSLNDIVALEQLGFRLAVTMNEEGRLPQSWFGSFCSFPSVSQQQS